MYVVDALAPVTVAIGHHPVSVGGNAGVGALVEINRSIVAGLGGQAPAPAVVA